MSKPFVFLSPYIGEPQSQPSIHDAIAEASRRIYAQALPVDVLHLSAWQFLTTRIFWPELRAVITPYRVYSTLVGLWRAFDRGAMTSPTLSFETLLRRACAQEADPAATFERICKAQAALMGRPRS